MPFKYLIIDMYHVATDKIGQIEAIITRIWRQVSHLMCIVKYDASTFSLTNDTIFTSVLNVP